MFFLLSDKFFIIITKLLFTLYICWLDYFIRDFIFLNFFYKHFSKEEIYFKLLFHFTNLTILIKFHQYFNYSNLNLYSIIFILISTFILKSKIQCNLQFEFDFFINQI
jgi:hypothetical protein